jgi:hypothetical protein
LEHNHEFLSTHQVHGIRIILYYTRTHSRAVAVQYMRAHCVRVCIFMCMYVQARVFISAWVLECVRADIRLCVSVYIRASFKRRSNRVFVRVCLANKNKIAWSNTEDWLTFSPTLTTKPVNSIITRYLKPGRADKLSVPGCLHAM